MKSWFQWPWRPQYALKNPLLGWILSDLSLEQARAIIWTLRESERAATLVWKTGWPDWKHFQHPECEKLQQPQAEVVHFPPGGMDQPFADDLTVVRAKEARTWMDRKFPRYDVRLPATVVAGRNQFRTQTENISLGGLCLMNPLPDWVAGYCTLIVDMPTGEELELVCTIAEDQFGEKYRLEIVQSLNFDRLRAWLEQASGEAEKKDPAKLAKAE